MQSYEHLANRIESAAERLLGHQSATHQIREWCEQYRHQCQGILASRGVSLPSVAIVGAKGQGKTWVARQFVLDHRIAEMLPSGVLSTEATTLLYWVGPKAPENLDDSSEVYYPCRSESMLDLRQPYMLLDTPGITDDDLQAAKIAKDALTLSPIKLLVVRRDQLRCAIVGSLALNTEGAICIPVITCVPLRECQRPREDGVDVVLDASLSADMAQFENALRGIAPGTTFLDAVYIEDFEASGNELEAGRRFRKDFQQRTASESLEKIAATRTNRLDAAAQRLRSRIEQLLEKELPSLANAVRKLKHEAESLPAQTIETVLGSPSVLQTAVRGRIRAQILSDTGMIWFPYRTILSILGFTNGAWDRLILTFTGSVPSIFGTFVAWAKNWKESKSVQWELSDGIRERLNRQTIDRLEPVLEGFYRNVDRIRKETPSSRGLATISQSVRLTGIDELQTRARSTFEQCVDREQVPRWLLQMLGLVGSLLFWGMLAGPIFAIYRSYITASLRTLGGEAVAFNSFQWSPSLVFTSILLSALPLLVYCMVVMSWLQRGGKVKRLASTVLNEEHRLVEELKQSGVIRLLYDDPLLQDAEFLIHLKS